ncbi:MAG: serine/threonine protein kinase, partial [Deltaproteobacteria bacterium]
MLEPLSEPIRKLLLELKLCSEHDLRRCRRLVRRLTRDLPTFDSVWLDALVQIGCLTPYQARLLESSNRRALEIGPCVAINRLGGGTSNETCLARARDRRDLCVTKILRTAGQLSEESLERLVRLVERLKGFEHPSIVAPFSCVRADNQVVLVSRYIAGPHLSELLVRRGRFPAAIVWEIGRQLAEGLDALARLDIAHGDIRPGNVRLLSSGTSVLVDTGIGPAIDPAFTVRAGLAPERCDGVAPELIGGSLVPDVRSDAYALGCLLWQLLAGRPPFPGGDPLAKLAAHQTRTIDDVRKWAPDTPPALAEGIRRLTARRPSERPASFAEVLQVWQAPGRRGRSKLAEFRRRFDAPAHVARTGRRLSTPTRWLLVLAALFALSGGALTLADHGARNVVLAWAERVSETICREVPEREQSQSGLPVGLRDETTVLDTDEAAPPGRPLPAPDRHGVIRLDARGPWRSSEITAVGELTIAGDGDALPEIVIDERPLRLCAELVRLRHVRIRAVPEDVDQPSHRNALLLVQSQGLAIEECIFDAGRSSDSGTADRRDPVTAPATGPALVAW